MIRQWFGNQSGRLYAAVFVLLLHIARMLAGSAPWLRYGARVGSRRCAARDRLAFGGAYSILAIAMVGAPAIAWRERVTGEERYRIRNPSIVPLTMNEEGAGS